MKKKNNNVPAVNEQNRAFIDRFVSENYKRLARKFSGNGDSIDSSGFGSMDKLNETLFSLYVDPKLCFSSWDEAERYLLSRFVEKEMRVPVRKPTKEAKEDGSN